MFGAIDNGILVTDLDAAGFNILNIAGIFPVPPNLVTTTDPRLSDARLPLDGSVTNSSVSASAAIDQSKLNLNGTIPIDWLGFDAVHAAPADSTEYLMFKGIANGYASLDGTGKVPVLQLPDDIGVGTVTSVDLVMPSDFGVTGNPVTTAGTITVAWNAVAPFSWFGNVTAGSAVPVFNTVPIASTMVPQLPASKIDTGTVDPQRLPPAVGVGLGHSAGAVPDPGAVGSPDDYLARDMTFKPPPSIGPSYQPSVPSPVLQVGGIGPDVIVTISSPLAGVLLFYKITGMPSYVEAPDSVHVLTGQTLDVYGAKAGYTNSNIVFYVNP